MSIFESRKDRSIVPVAVVGALVASLAVGGVYAGLSTVITTEDTEKIYNGLTFDYAWSVDSEPIVKDVTPVHAPEAEVFSKSIQNLSTVDAQVAFSFSNVDVSSIPDSILDETTVEMVIDEGYGVTLTLREALENAVVFQQAVAGAADSTIVVSITAPNNGSPTDFSDALDFEEATFNTSVTFSQLINGSSDLYNYAVDNGSLVAGGNFLGDEVHIFPVGDLEAALGN